MTQTAAQSEAAAYAESQDAFWRATALNQATNSMVPGSNNGLVRDDNANKDLLKVAEKYYKFLSAAKNEVDSSARNSALQAATNYPVEGVEKIDRAQAIYEFLHPKK